MSTKQTIDLSVIENRLEEIRSEREIYRNNLITQANNWVNQELAKYDSAIGELEKLLNGNQDGAKSGNRRRRVAGRGARADDSAADHSRQPTADGEVQPDS